MSRFTQGAVTGFLLALAVFVVAASARAALKGEHAKAVAEVAAAQPALDQVQAQGRYLEDVAAAAHNAVVQGKPNRAMKLIARARKYAEGVDDALAAAHAAIKVTDDGVPDDVAPEMFYVMEPGARSANPVH